MLKQRKPGLVAKLAIIVSVLLIAANLFLGIILINQSRNAIKTLIQNRMLDIVNSAADMLDGDVLMTLSAEDEGTEPYRSIYDILSVFQRNTGLRYIYCIRDVGGGNFIFTIDTDPETPAEFGEPVVRTDALIQAARGYASVDEEPYTDAWGRFYSAYGPVFDSRGEVSGIVAVDFPAEWYDDQLQKQGRAIITYSFLAVVIGIMLILFSTSTLRRELNAITSDISDMAGDVHALTKELDPDYTSGIEENSNTEDIHFLSQQIRLLKDSLRHYTDDVNSHANSMITALSSDYHSVYYIDLDNDEGVCYQSHTQINNGLRQGEHFPYIKTLRRYASEYVTEKYRDSFLRFIEPSEVRKNLEKERIITFRYMIFRNNHESYEMVRMAGVRHPEDRDDHIVHAIGMGFTDVDAETRRTLNQSQALSDALSAAEAASKAKTAFLSSMSHEIRTPMNAIIGLDKIALNDPELKDSTRTHLEKIGTSADHLLSIINDILDMSRIEAGRMVIRQEIFSLTSLIEQISVMIGGQCEEKGLNWHYEIVGDTEDFYIGDDMKLKQVLINILGNSVKFTPAGGDISFTAEIIARYDNKSTFRFTIADTGIGMSKEYLPKLFEPFSQEDLSTRTKYGSTGLGMSITKNIVEMMNGDIQVESEKNVGTTFTVTVTFTDVEQKTDEDGVVSPQGMSVLIVDDDPVSCEYAKMELEKAGVSSEIALSGAEAVEMVMLKHARRESYNLILVDWQMPEMDGLDTTRQIRSIIGYDSAIVVLTSFHWDDVMTDATEAGVDSFIAKPLMADSLLHQFKQIFVTKARNAGSKADLTGRRVLLAEDVDVNAEIVMMILDMKEISVDHAENGRIAVDMFSSHPEGYYCAILMDMRMPEMDGLEAAQTIRKLERADAKTIPIIALTANAFDEDVQRSLQAGLNAHLSKPIDPDNLFETLESLVKP